MGFVALILIALAAVYLYYKFFPGKILDITGLGKWVVVTGATDGIGKAFTHELAGKGYNVVLVSRNTDKLRSCAKEIQEKFHVSTKIVQADFSSSDEQMYSRIKSELNDMDIGILVNNVGTVIRHPDRFLDHEKYHDDYYMGVINCNIVSAVNMTRFVMPGMVRREKGLIINVSSEFSRFPSPFYTMYGATKSFLNKFSRELDTEYNDKGVHVHVLTTGPVTTKLSRLRKTSFFIPSPQVYVKSALEEITKKRYCEGYIGHSIVASILSLALFLFPGFTIRFFVKQIDDLRRKYIKRCEKCYHEEQSRVCSDKM